MYLSCSRVHSTEIANTCVIGSDLLFNLIHRLCLNSRLGMTSDFHVQLLDGAESTHCEETP